MVSNTLIVRIVGFYAMFRKIGDLARIAHYGTSYTHNSFFSNEIAGLYMAPLESLATNVYCVGLRFVAAKLYPQHIRLASETL